MVLVGVIGILMEPQQESRITYSDVTNAFAAGQVTDFVIDENKLTMTLKNGSQFAYQLPSVECLLRRCGETIKEQREAGTLTQDFVEQASMPWWTAFLPYLIIIVLFGLFWYYMMNKQDGGAKSAMSFGKSRAKLATDDNKKVTFADVAGADERKERSAGSGGVFKSAEEIPAAGRPHSQGRAAGGPSGYRQDPDRQGSGR